MGEIDREGNYIEYTKLRGVGPRTGWVKVKRYGCKPDFEQSAERPSMNKSGGELRVVPFRWDKEEAQTLMEGGNFDIIVCADCVYEPGYGLTWKDLADCLEVFCARDTSIFLALTRRYQDGVDGFLERLKVGPLVIANLETSKACEGNVEMMLLRRATPPEDFYMEMNRNGERADSPDAANARRRARKAEA